MRGLIGVSCADTGRFSQFWDSLIHLEKPDGEVAIEICRSAVISKNRNVLTERMLEQKCDWIFYCDDDQIYAPDTLIKLLSRDKPVISGLYLAREAPYAPVIFNYEDERGFLANRFLSHTDSGIIPILACGAGALLVRREVIESLTPPYWTLGQIDPTDWCDDTSFCHRVRKAGFKIFCDLDTPVGHKVNGTIWPQRSTEGWVTTLVSNVKGFNEAPIAHFPQPKSKVSL